MTPDVVTDQTPAHEALMYVPSGWSVSAADDLRKSDPVQYRQRAMESMAAHVQAMLAFQRRGAEVFDYGNNLRQQAFNHGVTDAFEFPGFVPAYIRPLFCEGKGPFRWVALSGEPEDIYRTDEAVMQLFPEDAHLRRWLTLARERVPFQGLPARICWLGYGERVRAGLRFNEMVAEGILKAPIVIGRDHLDAGSVASPNRETEGMLDGSDAISDWPILNALINAVGGATWVSFHHGGGVGIGYSQHAGQVIVADGTPEAARTPGTSADNRPRHGGRASCGRRVRNCDRGSSPAWDQDADAAAMKPLRMRPERFSVRVGALSASLVVCGLLLAACTIGPFRFSIPGQLTPQPAIVLRWCDEARDVLCVLSFGLEPPGQMLIVLIASPGLPADLEAKAAWNGETGSYPCDASNANATILACAGPLIPLGSGVHIEVAADDGKTLIAAGDFVLNALALPTVSAGGELPPTDAVSMTPRLTRDSGGHALARIDAHASTNADAPSRHALPQSDTQVMGSSARS